MGSSGSSVRSPSRRLGSETPRIWTRPLRELTPETTLGFHVIEFAEEVLEILLLPWQKWLLVHMLELLPDNSLRFRTVIVLVARQNGKSTLSQIVALWFMYQYGSKLVLGTAQDLDTAEEVWQGAVDLVTELGEDDEPVRPELHALLDRVVMVNGKKSLVLKSGERYKVKAANRRAGRGLSGDVVLLDELREHQSWDAWGAITKTTMARAMALILALSNAGDATSIVLRYLRRMTIAALVDAGHEGLRGELEDIDQVVVGLDEYVEDGIADAEAFANEGDDSVAIFEWSAPPGCGIHDRDAWAQANPSLGHTITERTIASAATTDPEWIFRTEVLCQWSSGSLEGPFPSGAWEAGRDDRPEGERSTIVGADRIYVGVDVAMDRGTGHVAFAALNQYGRPHVEVVASRAGVEWMHLWLAERMMRRPLVAIAGQEKGAPVSALLEDFAAADMPIVPWGGTDLPAGSARFYDMVCNNEIAHLVQPLLDVAAATATTKPLGEAWVWNRRQSPTDIGPLVAANAAVWALMRDLTKPKNAGRGRVIALD